MRMEIETRRWSIEATWGHRTLGLGWWKGSTWLFHLDRDWEDGKVFGWRIGPLYYYNLN